MLLRLSFSPPFPFRFNIVMYSIPTVNRSRSIYNLFEELANHVLSNLVINDQLLHVVK